MSYIDAYYDTRKDKIYVSERDNSDNLLFKEYAPVYEFYIKNDSGEYESISDERASLIICKDRKDFNQKVKEYKQIVKTFEADHNVLFKTISRYYNQSPVPNLHIGFFDIEVDFDPTGFPKPENVPITSITVYKKWLKEYRTFVVKPDTLNVEQASDICSQIENVYLCTDEKALLRSFLDYIQDIDVLSGYNSEGFDIPFIVERIKSQLSEAYTRRLCHFNLKPDERNISSYGKTITTYNLIGRIHLDYLLLYKKHDQQGKDSYSLDSVCEEELGEKKLDYEGTLDELYKNDFKRFIEYNIQDTILLSKLDDKFDYIKLHFMIAHENCVTVSATMGTVSWIDQALINESHADNKIVADIGEKTIEKPAAGARVADTLAGVYNDVGAIDINSLYPSALRSLNMSIETILGQIRTIYTDAYIEHKIVTENLYHSDDGIKVPSYGKAWNGLFCVFEYDMVMNKTDDKLIVDFIDNTSIEVTACQLYNFIIENNISISANGTLFRNDKEGIIPRVLARWFAERKLIKQELEIYTSLCEGIPLDDDLINMLST